jgi:hypothetical protein
MLGIKPAPSSVEGTLVQLMKTINIKPKKPIKLRTVNFECMFV